MTNHRRTLWLSVVAACAASLIACQPADNDAASLTSPSDWAVLPQAVHRVCGGPNTVTGIDVSHWQGTIDWDQVAASGEIGWAYIRIGDGLGTDSQFDRNWKEARRAGIPRGAYHFFRPERDPIQQAEHFMEMVNAAGGYLPDDLPPMIDVEDAGDQSRSAVGDGMEAWMAYVQAQTGMQPVIYTGSYFWDANGDGDRFADYHLWSPHYTTNPCPYVPDAWETWTIWQYTDSGRVSGISGNVDMNHFNGPLEDLLAWPQCSNVRPISDCGAPAWWCEPINALNTMGILTRTCDDFRGGDRFNRSEWAALISRSLLLDQTAAYPLCRLPFADVAEDDWFARDVAALAGLDHGDGVSVLSTERTTFDANNAVTRCEAVKLIAESWNLPAADNQTLLFSDQADIPAWCLPYVKRAVAGQIVSHVADPFRGQDPTTAGEGAAMLSNAIDAHGRPTPAQADFYEPSCQPPLTCEDQCAANARRCAGADVEVCAEGANGCTAWAQPQRCSQGQACEGADAVCVDVCDTSCTPDDKRCEGEAAFQICTTDDQGCPVWSQVSQCTGGRICVGIGQCVDRCTLSTSQCDTSGASDVDPADTSGNTSGSSGGGGDLIGIAPGGGVTDCGCASVRQAPTSAPNPSPWIAGLLVGGAFLVSVWRRRAAQTVPRASTRSPRR